MGEYQNSTETWASYQRLVLASLDRIESMANANTLAIAEMKKDIAVLHVRASLWGGGAGGVVGAVGALVWHLVTNGAG